MLDKYHGAVSCLSSISYNLTLSTVDLPVPVPELYLGRQSRA